MERCFSHGDRGENICENVEKEVVMVEEEIRMMLWHGPTRCGKSSLALRYAFDIVRNASTDENSTSPENVPYVVLVCHDSMKNIPERFVSIQPCESCHTPIMSGRDVMYYDRIRIKYLQNVSQLSHFACSLHTLGGKCVAMVIDDFDLFVAETPLQADVYRCLALLHEAMNYMRRCHNTGQIVAVSLTSSFSKEDRERFRRWFDILLEIIPQSDDQIFSMQEELPKSLPSTAMRDWASYMPHFPPDYKVLYQFVSNEHNQDGVLRFLHAG